MDAAASLRATRRTVLRAAGAGAVAALGSVAGCLGGAGEPGLEGSLAAIGPGTMYKSPTCSCCDQYAAYLAGHDLPVSVEPTDDRDPVWTAQGVPANLRSCHTLLTDRYVVEGHVPGRALRALVADRPSIAGLALPGMPSGSPGMPGPRTGPFVVWALHGDGTPTVFMEV